MARNTGIRTEPSPPTATLSAATCALEGCGVPLLPRPGPRPDGTRARGGRPRLYCSDAHRSEARRRRLRVGGGGRSGHGRSQFGPATPYAGPRSGGDPLERARELLAEALTTLERFVDEATAGSVVDARREEAMVAAIRAEATAEVLRAQQAAADAARRASAVQEHAARERGEWQETLQQLLEDRTRREALVEELTGAVAGARAELEDELLRHHADAEHAESLLEVQQAAHESTMQETAAELEALRQRLTRALAEAEQARLQATRAEELLSEGAAATVELEVRAARAEEQSRLATDRLDDAKGELERLRQELTEERRHHRAVETELRRHVAERGPAATANSRGSRRPAGPVEKARSR